MNIEDINLLVIQPSQFHISNEKVVRIKTWFHPDDLSNFKPVTIKQLHGNIIFTDGHTRAFVAQQYGVEKIPMVWDEDELDEEFYQACVDACIQKGIISIKDLVGQALAKEEYKEKWIGWCETTLETLKQRKKKCMVL